MPWTSLKAVHIVTSNGSPVGTGVLCIGDDMSGAFLLTFSMEMREILSYPLVPVNVDTLATSFVSMQTGSIIGKDTKHTVITADTIFGGPFEQILEPISNVAVEHVVGSKKGTTAMVKSIEKMAEKAHQGHNVRVTKSKTRATLEQTTISIAEIEVSLTAKNARVDNDGHHALCQPRGQCASVDDRGASSECKTLMHCSHNSHSLCSYTVILVRVELTMGKVSRL